MKSEPVRPPINLSKLTQAETEGLMRDYDFVKWKDDLDKRAAEAVQSGKYKEVLDGRTKKPSP